MMNPGQVPSQPKAFTPTPTTPTTPTTNSMNPMTPNTYNQQYTPQNAFIPAMQQQSSYLSSPNTFIRPTGIVQSAPPTSYAPPTTFNPLTSPPPPTSTPFNQMPPPSTSTMNPTTPPPSSTDNGMNAVNPTSNLPNSFSAFEQGNKSHKKGITAAALYSIGSQPIGYPTNDVNNNINQQQQQQTNPSAAFPPNQSSLNSPAQAIKEEVPPAPAPIYKQPEARPVPPNERLDLNKIPHPLPQKEMAKYYSGATNE
ncbi:hypothetical protein WA158_002458, partial [Blastocystis sp. Blastoise]